MGPMQTESVGGKKYVLVVMDDYSRFTWVRFLKGKSDTANICISLCLNLQQEKGIKIIRIRSDHGKEIMKILIITVSQKEYIMNFLLL